MNWVKAITVAIVIAGCGSTQIKRDVAKQGWHELTSEHFVLVTDLPAPMAIQRLRELESMWHALADNYVLVAPALPPPKHRLRVVQLNSCRDFRRIIWAPGIGGYVSTTIDFEGSRMMVTCEWRGQRVNPRGEILLHELAHVFNNHYFSRTPAWLNEGLATYYQTMQLRRGKVTIGNMSYMDATKWRSPRWMPTITQLTGFSYGQFYSKRRRNYYAGWKLVHLLNSTKAYQKVFRRYMFRLAKGEAHQAAWDATIGRIGMAKLQSQFKRYEHRGGIRLWSRPYMAKTKLGSLSTRKLRPGESHALWAHLQMIRADALGQKASEKQPVEAHLKYAAADDSAWAGTLFWRASYAFHFQRKANGLAVAAQLLRQYVKRQPDDGRGWLGLVKVGLAKLVAADHLGVEPKPPTGLATLSKDVAALLRVARTEEQLNAVGWYYALLRRPRTGLNFAVRALRLRPRCTRCMNTLALLLYQRGDTKQAHDMMRKAIHLRAEQHIPDNWRKRLTHYQRALAKTPPAPN